MCIHHSPLGRSYLNKFSVENDEKFKTHRKRLINMYVNNKNNKPVTHSSA